MNPETSTFPAEGRPVRPSALSCLSEECAGPHDIEESLPDVSIHSGPLRRLTPPTTEKEVFDERGQRTRDRVLLYVRGMDIPPLRSLAFAAESLSRTGPAASPAEAMRSLREVLREEGRMEGRQYGLENNEEGKLDSAPPINRRSMIAEKLDRKPWLTAIARLFFGRPAISEDVAPQTPQQETNVQGEHHHD